jgi:AcrR family transcriptional regulator
MNLRERKKLEAWRALRGAALDLFDRQGFEGTTVEQIAAAANVSRATFFNYFASKEAVVFDQDPTERDRWLAVMADVTGQPLWDAITELLLTSTTDVRETMVLQRRLKAASPALAHSTQDFDEQFRTDLQQWVASCTADTDRLTATLQVNLALAAAATAYQTWGADEAFEDFHRRLQECLRQARPGQDVATRPPARTGC